MRMIQDYCFYFNVKVIEIDNIMLVFSKTRNFEYMESSYHSINFKSNTQKKCFNDVKFVIL